MWWSLRVDIKVTVWNSYGDERGGGGDKKSIYTNKTLRSSNTDYEFI